MDIKMLVVTLALGVVSFAPNKYTQLIGIIIFNIFFWNWKRIFEVTFGIKDYNGNRI